MRSPIRFFAAAAILLATATVAAQVYKWVDKDGKVQYSDQPPPASAGKADPKKLSDAPASGASASPASSPGKAAESPKDAEKRKKDQAKKEEDAAKKAADDARRAADDAENCRNARSALRDLESGRPLQRTDEKGDRYFVSDEQRQADIARTREIASTSCK
jgi:hypothetical protein